MSSFFKMAGLAFLFVIVFSQCSTPSSTMIVDSWSDYEYKTSGFRNILVVGIARRPEVRTSFEYELKSKLKNKNVAVIASSDVMPLDEKIDEETFHKYFIDKNIEAVFVTRLVAVDELPSNANTNKTQHLDASSFYDYYDSHYGAEAEAEMDKQNLILKVETNLYETREQKKVWSCTSKSFQQGQTAKLLNDLAKTIADAAKEDGFVLR